ncbi:cyclic nucleotide-binding domain-containing protein [Geovibrio thiophilus]|uniref:Cyclic nucleotide-binding domain-containing protein n=1 Tax=Geovibrio thiophilus TaxID=139438 RepID=A0A410JW36_9BACT|nr:cyclic nucleotide-binding domain-containing protein [Geovibrio thiophilus]QAR32269.1 cyclic nucleotide-binding domain-containing protein [Geovibrio thiophilus]
MKTSAAILKKNPKFADFSEAEMEEFLSYFTKESYNAGRLILKEGDKGDRFCIIAEGEVGISKDVNDQTCIFLNNLKAGDFFGEMAILTGYPRSANATASTMVAILSITADRLTEMKTAHPVIFSKFVWIMAKTVSERMFKLEERLSGILNASLSENFL